jgi:hypothetical protein
MLEMRQLSFFARRALIFCLLAPSFGFAEARARIRPAVVLQGQSCILEVEIEEGLIDRMPDPPRIPGLAIQPLSASRIRRENMVNVVASFEVVPETATGTVRIPSFPIPLSAGGSVSTQELVLHVLKEEEAGPPPPTNRLLHCLTLTPGRDFSSGERFPMQVLVLVDASTNLQNLEQPKLPRDGVAVDRLENPMQGRMRYAGRNWLSFAYATRATAMGAGEVKLGPLEARATVAVTEDSTDGFTRWRNYPISTTGEAVALNIRPFPEGAPQGFTGAVGKFNVEASFDPAPGRPGDPIAIQLIVRGRGDESQITVPQLSDESGWEIFEGTKEIRPTDTSDPEVEVRFRRILRPLRDPGESIPPFRLVYLDPETRAYAVAESKPLELPVAARGAPPTVPTAPATTPAGSAPKAAPPAPAPLVANELLLDLPAPARWHDSRDTLRRATVGLHATGIAALLFGAGAASWRRYRDSTAGKRAALRRKMKKSLRASLRAPEEEERLLLALRWQEEWSRSPFGRPLTRDEAANLRAWRDALDSVRYAPKSTRVSYPELRGLESLLVPPN